MTDRMLMKSEANAEAYEHITRVVGWFMFVFVVGIFAVSIIGLGVSSELRTLTSIQQKISTTQLSTTPADVEKKVILLTEKVERIEAERNARWQELDARLEAAGLKKNSIAAIAE